MNDTTQRVRADPVVPWWKATVPPWTTVMILVGAGFIGLLIGFSIF